MRPHVLHLVSQEHVDRDGNVVWKSDEHVCNILTDEGEQALLSAYFDTDLAGYGAPPANLHLGLSNLATLAESDTINTHDDTEPSTGAYARKAVSTTTGFTLSQPGAYYKATSAQVTWTATGAAYASVSKVFLCTVASGNAGKLIAALALSATRTLQDGDALNLTFAIGLHE